MLKAIKAVAMVKAVRTKKRVRKLRYVVRGAVVECGSGSQPTRFMPPYRGITIGEGWPGTEYDTLPEHFEGTFGICKITGKPCTMSSFLPKWYYPSERVKYRVDPYEIDLSLPDNEIIKETPAAEALLIMKSVLVCTKGDKVTFVTDGQEFGSGDGENPFTGPMLAIILALLRGGMPLPVIMAALKNFFGERFEGMRGLLERSLAENATGNVNFNPQTGAGDSDEEEIVSNPNLQPRVGEWENATEERRAWLNRNWRDRHAPVLTVADLEGKKVYLSPSLQRGNGFTFNNLRIGGQLHEEFEHIEVHYCRSMAALIATRLAQSGIEVMIGDVVYGGLAELRARANESNDWGADLYLPVHTNATVTDAQRTARIPGNRRGPEVYYEARSSPTRIADTNSWRILHNHLLRLYRKQVGQPTRLVGIPFPAAETWYSNARFMAYLEIGHHDNVYDVDWMWDRTTDISVAIANGIKEILGQSEETQEEAPEEELLNQEEEVCQENIF